MPYKDKKRQLEYQRRWMAKRRADFFEGKKCKECGSDQSLELDHIDPKTKVDHRIWSWRWERRQAELKKCQVLCERCHMKKTADSLRSDDPHGEERWYSWGKCRCDRCRIAHRDYVRQRRARIAQQKIDDSLKSENNNP